MFDPHSLLIVVEMYVEQNVTLIVYRVRGFTYICSLCMIPQPEITAILFK
jgi:hypothetical protein